MPNSHDLDDNRELRVKRLSRMQSRLNGLTHKALDALESALTDDSGATRVAAAREILNRAWGKPRQQVQIEGSVKAVHEIQLEQLRQMTMKQLQGTNAGPMIDAKPLETLDNSGTTTKEPINLTADTVTYDSPPDS